MDLSDDEEGSPGIEVIDVPPPLPSDDDDIQEVG